MINSISLILLKRSRFRKLSLQTYVMAKKESLWFKEEKYYKWLQLHNLIFLSNTIWKSLCDQIKWFYFNGEFLGIDRRYFIDGNFVRYYRANSFRKIKWCRIMYTLMKCSLKHILSEALGLTVSFKWNSWKIKDCWKIK